MAPGYTASPQPKAGTRERLAAVTLIVTLIVILLIGASLRFVELGSLPPGIYRDEAYNGLDALAVLEGQTPLFFEANNGREPLFIYLLALPIALLGASPLALRLTSAIVGTLTIPTIYWLTRELSSPLEGLVAAFLAATTVWSVNLSRVAFRAVVMIPILAISLALWCRASRFRSWTLALLAGIAYGLSWYTYLAARFGALAFVIAWLIAWRRGRAWWKGWLTFGLGAIAVASPLLWYMAAHWDATVARPSQVSIFNASIHGGQPWQPLAGNIGRTLLAWIWRGDFIPRHNIPLRPVFQPLLAAAFALGTYLAARRARHVPGMVLALVCLGVMLLPTILAEGAPHFLRGSGVLPVLYIFPALGIAHVVRLVRPHIGPRITGIATVVLLLAHAGAGMHAYFRHLDSEAVYYNFEAGATALAADFNAFLGTGWQGETVPASPQASEDTRQAYIAPRLWDNWPSLRFLCHHAELGFLPASEPPSAQWALVVAWPYEDLSSARAALPRDRLIRVREGSLERGDLELEPRLLYVAFEAGPREEAPANLNQPWQHGISLLGYEVSRLPNERICVTLFWRCQQSLDTNYVAFVHLLDEGELIGQHDGPTGLGYYPTDAWRPDDVLADIHVIDAVGGIPETAQLAVGLYKYPTMEHLHPVMPSGALSDADQIVLPLWP
ncbi:MAG: glycosyltransferase family 39 protein [Anaerolineae bacterium]